MNLNLDQHIIDSLDELARRERRSRSMMANLLLEEALMGALAEPGNPRQGGVIYDGLRSAGISRRNQ